MSISFTLFMGDQAWRVGRVEDDEVTVSGIAVEPGATPADIVAKVAGALSEAGYAGEGVVLALPSSRCLSAEVATGDIQRGGRKQALAYRLEEHLPISAEQTVAAFHRIDDERALGVCVEHEFIAAWVELLEAEGVRVEHVCPMALMAAGSDSVADTPVDGVLIAAADHASDDHNQYDVVEWTNDRPTGWRWFGRDEAALLEHLGRLGDREGPAVRIKTMGCSESLLSKVGGVSGINAEMIAGREVFEQASLHAVEVLAGRCVLWIDLRCDRLARTDQQGALYRPKVALVLALMLLLGCVFVAGQWRGRQYRSLASQHLQDQVEVFRGALPDQSVPSSGNILGRMLSEQRKMAALSGNAGSTGETDLIVSGSALDYLEEFLVSLPGDVPFRVLDIDIEPDRTTVNGEARQHIEAAHITQALRSGGRFRVDAPTTESLGDQGVRFDFSAEHVVGAAGDREGGR